MLPNQYDTGGSGSIYPSLRGMYASYATVKFSATSITIKAGQTAKFTANFTPPTDIADRYLPVYSGMIKVKNNNDAFTITYL
jgi:hypothetical protein